MQLELEKDIQKSLVATPLHHTWLQISQESPSFATPQLNTTKYFPPVLALLSSFQATKYFAACFVFAIPVTHGYYLAKEARGARSGLMSYGYCHFLRQENSSNVIWRSYDYFFFFFAAQKWHSGMNKILTLSAIISITVLLKLFSTLPAPSSINLNQHYYLLISSTNQQQKYEGHIQCRPSYFRMLLLILHPPSSSCKQNCIIQSFSPHTLEWKQPLLLGCLLPSLKELRHDLDILFQHWEKKSQYVTNAMYQNSFLYILKYFDLFQTTGFTRSKRKKSVPITAQTWVSFWDMAQFDFVTGEGYKARFNMISPYTVLNLWPPSVTKEFRATLKLPARIFNQLMPIGTKYNMQQHF